MLTREQTKATLKQRGWSYRAVAPFLGVTYQHVCLVLRGKRESRRVLQAIHDIPPRVVVEQQVAAGRRTKDRGKGQMCHRGKFEGLPKTTQDDGRNTSEETTI